MGVFVLLTDSRSQLIELKMPDLKGKTESVWLIDQAQKQTSPSCWSECAALV